MLHFEEYGNWITGPMESSRKNGKNLEAILCHDIVTYWTDLFHKKPRRFAFQKKKRRSLTYTYKHNCFQTRMKKRKKPKSQEIMK
jgi:hypothetical protein